MNLPEELYYSEEHEWARKEDNRVYVGITDFAQSELGDVVFVELPEEGEEFDVGDAFGTVESVKTVSELYAPVSGKVVEVNEDLEDNPEYVNESPYEDAWMIVIEMDDEAELDNLLSSEQYKEVIEE
ncbi:MAG TPA: glycine cleavage system protein GcvH [Bacillota bacterium]|nr:glycine cleavage system protein GcvH [Bacillota bacterium]